MTPEGSGGGTAGLSEGQQGILQEIYAGAQEADLRVAGISEVEVGPREGAPGDALTLTVRVSESGALLPRRGDTDRAAASVLRLDVYPHIMEDSDNEKHVMWKAYARQVDVGTRSVFGVSASGATPEEIRELSAGREPHEYLDDQEFMDETLVKEAPTAAEAVRQALAPLADGSGGLNEGREQRGVAASSGDVGADPEGGQIRITNLDEADSAEDEGDVIVAGTLRADGGSEPPGSGGEITISGSDVEVASASSDPVASAAGGSASVAGGMGESGGGGGEITLEDPGDEGVVDLAGVIAAEGGYSRDHAQPGDDGAAGEIVVQVEDTDDETDVVAGGPGVASLRGGSPLLSESDQEDSDEGSVAGGAGGEITLEVSDDDGATVLYQRQGNNVDDGDDDDTESEFAESRLYAQGGAGGSIEISTDGSSIGESADPGTDDSRRRTIIRVVVGGVVVALLVVVGIVALSGGDDQEPIAAVAPPEPAAPQQPVEPEQPPVNEQPAPEPVADQPTDEVATPPDPVDQPPVVAEDPPAQDPPQEEPPAVDLTPQIPTGTWNGTMTFTPLPNSPSQVAFEATFKITIETDAEGNQVITLTQDPRNQVTTGLINDIRSAFKTSGGDGATYHEIYVALVRALASDQLEIVGVTFGGSPDLADRESEVIEALTTGTLSDGLLVLPGTDPVTGEPLTEEEALAIAQGMAEAGVDPSGFGIGWFTAISGVLEVADS